VVVKTDDTEADAVSTDTTNSYTITTVDNKTYSIKVRAKNEVGNWSVYSAFTSAIEVDKTAPTAPSPSTTTPSLTNSSTIEYTWEAVDGATEYEVVVKTDDTEADAVSTDTTNSYTITTVDNKTYSIKVRAKDEVGNWSDYSTFTSTTEVDKTAPTLTITDADATTNNSAIAWSFTKDADATIEGEIKSKPSSSNVTNVTISGNSASITADIDGDYSIQLTATDSAGNTTTQTSNLVTYDTTE